METFIFKILGLIYLPVVAGMFISKASYKKMLTAYSENPVAIFQGGLMSLIFGLALLSVRPYLLGTNSNIIIILGYISIAEGMVALILPDFVKFFVKLISENERHYKFAS